MTQNVLFQIVNIKIISFGERHDGNIGNYYKEEQNIQDTYQDCKDLTI